VHKTLKTKISRKESISWNFIIWLKKRKKKKEKAKSALQYCKVPIDHILEHNLSIQDENILVHGESLRRPYEYHPELLQTTAVHHGYRSPRTAEVQKLRVGKGFALLLMHSSTYATKWVHLMPN